MRRLRASAIATMHCAGATVVYMPAGALTHAAAGGTMRGTRDADSSIAKIKIQNIFVKE
jgi:hypothetical protein